MTLSRCFQSWSHLPIIRKMSEVGKVLRTSFAVHTITCFLLPGAREYELCRTLLCEQM